MSELKKNSRAQEQQGVYCLMQVCPDKLNELKVTGKDPSKVTTYEQSHHAVEIRAHLDELKDTETSIAGRMMSKRIMGKASFCVVRNLSGGIQAYMVRDAVGGEVYMQFKKYDTGDIIGVRGKVFETKTGEISIHAEESTLLTKSIQPLPEKFHSLADTDRRYRQHYIDLVMSPEVRETFVERSKIISSIWRYLDDRGFMEVKTPIPVSNAGDATAYPFKTHYSALSEDVKLRISLEFCLKRLIVGDLGRVYEIGRMFRNEGLDARRNLEFTLMELYQAYTDYESMMNLIEDIFRHVMREVNGNAKIIYSGTETDLEKLFRRITMIETVKEYSSVDFTTIETLERARAVAREKNITFEERHQRGDIPNLFFETFCKEHTIQPAFVADHPIEISPPARKKSNNPDYVKRFELFTYDREMCNACSELNDLIDQRERFRAQDTLAATGDEEANHTDEDFLNALNIGIPSTGSIGYGINRLVMLLTNSPTIRDVLLFPTMKTTKTEDKEVHDENGDKAERASGFFTPNEKIDFSGVKIEPLLENQVDFETFSKSDFHAVRVKGCRAVPRSREFPQFTLDSGTGTERTILSGIHVHYEPEELIGKTLVATMNLSPYPIMGIEPYSISLSAVSERNGEEELHLLIVDNHTPAGVKLY